MGFATTFSFPALAPSAQDLNYDPDPRLLCFDLLPNKLHDASTGADWSLKHRRHYNLAKGFESSWHQQTGRIVLDTDSREKASNTEHLCQEHAHCVCRGITVRGSSSGGLAMVSFKHLRQPTWRRAVPAENTVGWARGPEAFQTHAAASHRAWRNPTWSAGSASNRWIPHAAAAPHDHCHGAVLEDGGLQGTCARV